MCIGTHFALWMLRPTSTQWTEKPVAGSSFPPLQFTIVVSYATGVFFASVFATKVGENNTIAEIYQYVLRCANHLTLIFAYT